MKKEYIKPSVKAMAIETESLLKMSFGVSGDEDLGVAPIYMRKVSDEDEDEEWSGAW